MGSARKSKQSVRQHSRAFRSLLAVTALVLGLTQFAPGASADILGELFSVFEPSNEKEQSVGAEQHPKIVAQFGGEYIKEGLNDYILDIGLRLATVSEMKTLPWRFTVLNTPVVNAFALPGGYVYITRGLLALANSEAQVAGVLAHEIGHVTSHHSSARQSRATGIGLLGALAGILTGSDVVQQLGQQLGGMYVASYSRDQEYEADQLGVKYLGLAGYPREAMAGFLKRMRAQTDYTQALAGNEGKSSQFDFFASHPNTDDRVSRAAAMASENADNLDRDEGNKRYLEQINGMLYGDDPSEGVIKGREFLHPVLRFKFMAPEGFQLINSTQAVFAQDGKGSQMAFDIGKKKNQILNMAEYLKSEWLVKLKPSDVRTLEINGAAAAVTSLAVESNGKRWYLTAAAIDFGENRVARFMLQSASADQGLQQNFAQSYKSFRRLDASEANQIKPTLIDVETVKTGQSVDKLVAGMANIVSDKKALFLLLNPEFVDQEPTAGQLYKSLQYGK